MLNQQKQEVFQTPLPVRVGSGDDTNTPASGLYHYTNHRYAVV